MTTELILAKTEKRIARATALRRWGMRSIVLWPLGFLTGDLLVVGTWTAAAMGATLALVTISRMMEANAKLAAARVPQLPVARVVK